jgi:bacterioferritin-associated ferredoxin
MTFDLGEGCCPQREETGAGIVCRCLGITAQEIITAVTSGQAHTLRDLRRLTGAGTGCMCCHYLLRLYLERYRPVCPSSSSARPICSVK